MVNIKEPGAKVGIQSWLALNVFNHAPAPVGMTASLYEQRRDKYCAYIASTQDTVEDAITGNSLPIEDQLIFMEAVEVRDGVISPEYHEVGDVPGLVGMLALESPNRVQGCHVAQPVLCRAGPGTGKTWMIKQTLFLLATRLGGERAGAGIRLMPFVIYVQRVVRMLSELGEEPASLLADPEGLMRWYIRNDFAEAPDFCELLLLAYDMRALAILVDGVDEAAGMRDLIEAFVHYELVTSGNRLVVTSRPEGVDLDDYKAKFVVMNLKELSQEQQRNVIQMQLQGNMFFEHLVMLGECRRELDARYKRAFPSDGLQREVEALGMRDVDGDGILDANLTKEYDAAEGAPAAEPPGVGGALDAAGEAHASAPPARATRTPLTRRRLSLDSQQGLQTWMAEALPELQKPVKSAYLSAMNRTFMSPVSFNRTMIAASLLDLLDVEIRSVPSPCTKAQLHNAITLIDEAPPRGEGGRLEPTLREAITQLALLRKLPLPGGRRGAKAAPIPASGLWSQVVKCTDALYVAFHQLEPSIQYAVGRLAAACGVGELALHFDEGLGEWLPGTAEAEAELVYRDPVSLWLDCTYAGANEPTDEPPPAWCGTVRIQAGSGEACKELLKLLLTSPEYELADGLGEGRVGLTMLGMRNGFSPESHHPTHLRSAVCHMLVRTEERHTVVAIHIEHRDLIEHYTEAQYEPHYQFFAERALGLSLGAFNQKVTPPPPKRWRAGPPAKPERLNAATAPWPPPPPHARPRSAPTAPWPPSLRAHLSLQAAVAGGGPALPRAPTRQPALLVRCPAPPPPAPLPHRSA